MTPPPGPRRRIPALDIARTFALIAMAIYHSGYDLEALGRIAPGTMAGGFWFYFARSIAGTLLFLAGLSLWLAHGQGIRWRPFLRRLAQIAAAAGLVSLGTWFAFGPYFVFFGILHSVALSSLIGLAFLRLPGTLTLLAAAAVVWASLHPGAAPLQHQWLIWTGLTGIPVYAVDFVPTFPWLAPLLAGVGLARLAGRAGAWNGSDGGERPGRLVRALSLPGRHSLAVYLIHQPVLIAIFTGAARLGWI